MITLSDEAIENGFHAYVEHYVYARGWSIEERLRLFALAEEAFVPPGSLNHFSEMYQGLKKWEAFPGGSRAWDAEETLRRLVELSQPIREISLSNIRDANWLEVWKCLVAMRNIKTSETGGRFLVNIFKFAHFWNPRLFVVFDVEVMENYVFLHKWLASELPPVARVQELCGADMRNAMRLCKYLRVLIFASELVRATPRIRESFAATVKAHADPDVVPDRIEEYEGAAVEWLLLGLVELSPPGVRVG